MTRMDASHDLGEHEGEREHYASVGCAQCYSGEQDDSASLVPVWVNMYMVTREYGGPEEGGWWYDLYTPVEAVRTYSPSEASAVERRMRAEYEPGTVDRYSAAGGWDYLLRFEYKRAATYPPTRPVYA